MYSLLAYIVQVNILLAVIYAGYVFLLKNLTFYKLNRAYFLSGTVFSLFYPFLDIKSLFQRHIKPVGELVAYLPDFSVVDETPSVYTVENLLYAILVVGMLFFATKLLIQLLSLFRIHRHSVEAKWTNYLYRNVFFRIVPFSFLNKIYLNKEQHLETELYDIFKHEDVHVKGLHTVDILLFEMLLIGCWYNPFVWLMRKAVRQNLEFLTDQQVLNKGVDRQTYQYSLLHVTKQGASVGISNQFNFKLLKKRIMMMNKKRSSKLQLSKYAFLLPIIIFSAGAFTVSKADDKILEVAELAKDTRLKEVVANMKKDTVTSVDLSVMDTDVVNNHGAAESLKSDANQIDTSKVFLRFVKDSTLALQEGRSMQKGKVILLKTTGDKIDTRRILYVVDGEERPIGTDISDLDPNTIESIDVFKGSSATDKYGEKAIAGAVEVVTKEKSGLTFSGKVKGIKVASDTSKMQNIVVRGFKSNGGDPLIVIDGIEKGKGYDMKDMSPDNIESITVLKDASAMTLYGAEGKDGVLVITTKKERHDKPVGSQEVVVVGRKYPRSLALSKPAYYVDGKLVSSKQYEKIDTKKIKSIVTLGKKEADTYFSSSNKVVDLAGHDGVVIIETN